VFAFGRRAAILDGNAKRVLARVFAVDVTTCPCGGRLKIVEVALHPDAIALHLHGARAPPRTPLPGQLSLLPP